MLIIILKTIFLIIIFTVIFLSLGIQYNNSNNSSKDSNLNFIRGNNAYLDLKFDFNKFGLILSKYSYKIKTNDILAGIVVGVESNYALVDLGLKQVCFLPLNEISISPITNKVNPLNSNYIGEFLILNIHKNSQRIIISMKRVQSIYLWDRLRQIDFKNITIYARFIKPLGKGKLINFNGLSFFVLNIH